MTRPGHDGMPPQGPDFAEFLRHELHAAADQLEPRSDGLERIRARVRSGPAYASKHSAAQGGFLAGLVRRWNSARGGQEGGRGRRSTAAAAGLAVRAAPPGAGGRLRRVRHRRRAGSAPAARSLRPARLRGRDLQSQRRRWGSEHERRRYSDRLGGRRRRDRYFGRPGQRVGDRVHVWFGVVRPGQAGQADDLGDAERHPGELGEQPVRQHHEQRDERQPRRRQPARARPRPQPPRRPGPRAPPP